VPDARAIMSELAAFRARLHGEKKSDLRVVMFCSTTRAEQT
jgi:hypothetical protein